MADIARTILPLVGAYFFGPVGALVGGLLADVLFPLPGVKGPRLNELNIQTSTVGAPIPIVYGTAALAGNVIWSSGLIETKHEDEQGGFLGIGGQEITTYSYSVDVAIGICEGPISGIRRIWADADLIYDASDDTALTERIELGGVDAASIAEFLAAIRAMSAQLEKEIYLGTEDQLPDPTIESYEGVGTVPGYRGLAYIVLTGFQLEKYGNRIPNFRFEVYTGTPTECGLYSAGHLEPWVEGTRDPRNLFEGSYQYDGSGIWRDSFSAAVADLEAASSRSLFTSDASLHSWQKSGGANVQSPCDGIASDDQVVLYLNYNVVETSQRTCALVGPGTNGCDIAFNIYGAGNVFWHPGAQHGLFVVVPNAETEEQYFNGYSGSGSVSCADSGHYITDITDSVLAVRRTIEPPDPCAFGVPLAGAPGYCVVNGQITQGITWTEVAGTFKVLQRYLDNSSVVTSYPVGPALISTDPNYNNQAFWEAAYADALAAGEPIAPGLVYGVDYPVVTSSAWFSECETVDAECVPMATIVADICRRAGLRTDTASQIDVSGLMTCVQGYIIGRQMSGRDALGPLRAYGLWDAVESQAILTFVERGAALVETLTADDLGAHEAGSQAPSAVEVSRVQEKDLPRRLRLHFANFLHDHEPSEQAASRLSTEAVNELDVELPISMEPDTAAQLAEIMLYEAYVSRNTYRLALDNTWLALEPTDCIEIPVDGQTQRVRIVSVDYSIGGIARIEGVADDDGTYTSTAVATPGTPSGGVPGQGGSALICPSGLVLLDIPRLATGHIDAGYYAAIYNTCGDDGWECAELYRSNDGGLTYGRVARTNGETTVGEIESITGPATDPTLPGDSPAYDTTSSITVTLFEGTLASITDAQIAAGQNLAAVGVDGRWVIIQFKTATFDTGDQYTLTDLIWGVNGTEHLLGTTVDGDTFVLLSDSDLLRIPESADAIGVEKQFKAVTCGEAVDAVTPVSFTTWGLSYLRPCPSNVLSASLTEPPDDAADGDSYLLPNDTSLSGLWAEHGGQIATWSDETDNWVYCTPAPGTIIHVGGDSSDPGDDVISGGDGTTTPAPWTPAIPPLVEDSSIDAATDYLVIYTPEGYRKVLLSDAVVAGGGGDSSDTSAGGPTALDELTDVTIDTSVASCDLLTYVDTSGWANQSPSAVIDCMVGSPAQGDILYRNATEWTRLPAGTNGRFLKTQGAGANPIWSNVTAGGVAGEYTVVAQVADDVYTSNTTYTDTDLVVSLDASSTYQLEFFILASSHATPDMKVQSAYTGTWFGHHLQITNVPGAGALSGFGVSAIGPIWNYVTTATNYSWHAGYITTTTAGDFSIQAAQVSSSLTPVTFHKGSWLRVLKLF